MPFSEDQVKGPEAPVFRWKGYDTVRERIGRLILSSRDPVLIAIDGRCGSGKTTLASMLAREFDCCLFHMDDFYLQAWQRTPERLAEVGGNVDYERFRREILDPVQNGESVAYRPFDHSIMRIGSECREIPPKRLNIIEGSYSQHPYFEDPYDLRIFVTVSDAVRIARIRARNGEEKLKRFLDEWIPKEEAYFSRFGIEEKSLVIRGE